MGFMGGHHGSVSTVDLERRTSILMNATESEQQLRLLFYRSRVEWWLLRTSSSCVLPTTRAAWFKSIRVFRRTTRECSAPST